MGLLDELDMPAERPVLRVVEPVEAKSPMQLAWERWKSEIEKAAGENSLYPVSEVEAHLASGKAVILPGKQSAVVIEFQSFPGAAKVARVWWAVGDLAEIESMGPGLEAWARAQGCTDVLTEGRQGWAKKLKARGYAHFSTILRKAL